SFVEGCSLVVGACLSACPGSVPVYPVDAVCVGWFMKQVIIRMTRRRRLSGVAVLAAILAAIQGQAQESSSAANSAANGLTLDALVAEAMENNPELRFYQAEIAAAKAGRRTAGIWSNPELSGSIGQKTVR